MSLSAMWSIIRGSLRTWTSKSRIPSRTRTRKAWLSAPANVVSSLIVLLLVSKTCARVSFRRQSCVAHCTFGRSIVGQALVSVGGDEVAGVFKLVAGDYGSAIVVSHGDGVFAWSL